MVSTTFFTKRLPIEVPFSKIGLPLQPRFRTVRHILRGDKEARCANGTGSSPDGCCKQLHQFAMTPCLESKGPSGKRCTVATKNELILTTDVVHS